MSDLGCLYGQLDRILPETLQSEQAPFSSTKIASQAQQIHWQRIYSRVCFTHEVIRLKQVR